MILGYLMLAVGVAGFGFCGYKDLKTTEFPDWAPYLMIISALALRGVSAFLLSDLSIIIDSIIWGGLFLAFGFGLYLLRQWGDGDAWLLGAMGFLFPTSVGFAAQALVPFPLTVLANFFIISFAYMIAYSVIVGMRAEDAGKRFLGYLRKDRKGIALMIGGFTGLSFAVICGLYFIYSIPLGALAPIMVFPLFACFLVIFIHYGKFIEDELFKRKIPASKLRPGDVPVGARWRVLKEEEVRELKRKGGTVWIKEGVRFAPVFLITLLFSLAFGNIILAFIG